MILFLGKQPTDNGSQSVRKAHSEDESQVEEVIHERSSRQFLRTVVAHHDIVGKAYNNNAQLSQHNWDTQAYSLFIMIHQTELTD